MYNFPYPRTPEAQLVAESCVLSPDGKELAALTHREVRIWCTISGRLLRFTPTRNGVEDIERHLAWHPSRPQIARRAPKQQILLQSSLDFEFEAVLPGHGYGVWLADYHGLYRIAYLPGGDELLSSGADSRLHFWDVRDGRLLRSLPAPERSTSAALIPRPDGRQLLMTHKDRAWLVSLTDEDAPSRFLDGVRGIGWSPDGAALCIVDAKVLRVLQADSLTEEAQLELPDQLSCAAWVPGGGELAVVVGENTFLLWDPRTGKLRSREAPGEWQGLLISPEGEWGYQIGNDEVSKFRLDTGETLLQFTAWGRGL